MLGTLSLVGAAPAASSVASTSSQQPSIALRTAWTPARNYVIGAGQLFRLPQRRVCQQVRHPQPGPVHDPGRVGRSARPEPSPHQRRRHPDRQLVLQRHGHRQGLDRRAQPRGQRPGGRSGEPQQGRRRGGCCARSSAATTTRPGSGTLEKVSFARQCRGACRGRGGTPHSKYFMFNDVGSARVENVVMQTSMNFTKMGTRVSGTRPGVPRHQGLYNNFLRSPVRPEPAAQSESLPPLRVRQRRPTCSSRGPGPRRRATR